MSMADRDAATLRVIEELKRLYRAKILPLEQLYRYDYFFQPLMTDAEFDAKPQVLLVGQYSVGKTSFIRYLLGQDFPGQRIGPEPTTDRFVAVMDGSDERVIPGNALAVSADLPYRGLERFGVSFLNKFEGSQMPNPVLRNITLVDSPGVLSGEKQRVARGYDFVNVCAWFASRADLILMLFDAHKLDISDEFKAVIESLKGNDDKVRCVLNKADQVDRQKLMRVYGALMWSIGKVMKTPEVMRVYVGSFWDQPLQYDDNAALFEMEERDLMRDLRDLPRNSAVRKINELLKRVRLAKVHAYIVAYLKEQMPMLMGKERKQQELINDLPSVFRTVMKRYNLAPGDFPDLEMYRSKLAEQDFSKFAKLKPQLIDQVEQVLAYDIPRLMEALPRSVDSRPRMVDPMEEHAAAAPDAGAGTPPDYGEEKADQPPAADNPFGDDDEGAAANPFGDDDEAEATPVAAWDLQPWAEHYQAEWEAASPTGAPIPGAEARPLLAASEQPNKVLRKAWMLADIDRDGALDREEFVIAMYLAHQLAPAGHELPEELPESWIPPSKRT